MADAAHWFKHESWRSFPAMGAVLLTYALYTVFNPSDEPTGWVFFVFMALVPMAFAIPLVIDWPDHTQLARRVPLHLWILALPLSALILVSMNASIHASNWNFLGGFVIIWLAIATVMVFPLAWMTITMQASDGEFTADWWRALPFIALTGIPYLLFLIFQATNGGPGWESFGEWLSDHYQFVQAVMVVTIALSLTVPVVWGWPTWNTLLLRASKTLFLTSLAFVSGAFVMLKGEVTVAGEGLWPFLVSVMPFWALFLLLQALILASAAIIAYGVRRLVPRLIAAIQNSNVAGRV